MIDPRATDDWEEVCGGLVCVGSRALDDGERARVVASARRAGRVLWLSLLWCVSYVAGTAALVRSHWVEGDPVGIFVCVGALVTLAALGYGEAAWRTRRRLRADLENGRVRVFQGEALAPDEDAAIAFLAARRTFEPLQSAATGDASPRESACVVALLSSGLPLPAADEPLSPYIARPFRIARPPDPLARPGETRALSLAERDELRWHAARRRRMSLSLAVGVVYGAMSILALAVWAAHGFTRAHAGPVRGVQILVWNVLGIAAIGMAWSRRRRARALDAAAVGGEVTGSPDGEALPDGTPWTEGARAARWRCG